MTNQEILEKAIAKAIDGGWQQPEGRELDRVIVDIHWKADTRKRLPGINQEVESLIFNRSFAKALWGDTSEFEINLEDIPAWQYHLQQMVIADDPIEYLGNNI